MKARAAASGSSAAMMALTTAIPLAPSSASIETSATLTPPIARTGVLVSLRSVTKPQDCYGAYLRDPDGTKLCLYCHAPA